MKSKISCWRLVRSIPAAPCSALEPGLYERVFVRYQGSGRKQDRPILAAPRGGGGIGRRARLRALWGDCPVEVRVLFAASKAPQNAGLSVAFVEKRLPRWRGR